MDGKRIRELREEKEWTVRELAGRSGVAVGYISDLERGKKRNPSVALLTRLAESLGVTAKDLLE